MKYQYEKAPNLTELSVFTGLGTKALDAKTLAKDVPCQEACPARTDVPAYIRALTEGDPGKAYRINLEDNVFPSVLGRVCTRPCEDACRHNWTNVQGPVHICHLKRAGADHAPELPAPLSPWFQPTARRVAVVGGGPAGLTAARELVRYGHSVVLFERGSHLGGMMIDGIPRFRLPVDQVRREIALIVDSGIEVRLGQNVDAARMKALRDEFDAVLVATGTVKAKDLGLGAEGVIPGLKFMKDYNDGAIQTLEGDVVVIGGGFTAVDCARACARAARRILGSEHQVTIAYRRTEHHMAADLDELDEIKFENIAVRTLATPVRVNTAEGRIVSVTFQRNKLSDKKGADGKPGIEPIPGGEYDLPCSHLIAAVGQDADWSLLPKELQPAQDPKVFVAGELRTGSSDVIHCVAEGKDAAARIDLFLTGQTRITHHIAIDLVDSHEGTGRTRDDDLRRPAAMPLAPLSARVDMRHEVEQGHTHEGIGTHASRCYQCNVKFEIDHDKCIHCDWCIDVAPRACIKRVSRIFPDADGAPDQVVEANSAEKTTYIFIDSDECIRCGKCEKVCPTNAISARTMERVTCASELSLSSLVANARAEGRLPSGGWVPLRSKV
jgi:formate dehydrogenase major subunit